MISIHAIIRIRTSIYTYTYTYIRSCVFRLYHVMSYNVISCYAMQYHII
jgi:hypothetical protein